MKKLTALLLSLVMAFSLVACGGGDEGASSAGNDSADVGEISIFWYTFGDTYLSSVRAAMNATLDNAGANYHDYDANGSQTTQTDHSD